MLLSDDPPDMTQEFNLNIPAAIFLNSTRPVFIDVTPEITTSPVELLDTVPLVPLVLSEIVVVFIVTIPVEFEASND